MHDLTKELKRRAFIESGLKAAAATVLLSGPSIRLFATERTYTVQEVIDLILKEVPGAPFKDTVDTLKAGSPEQPVTGIVTTMFATVDVIKKAAALNANFIIAHEPTFYNHTDDLNWTGENGIVNQKMELLKQTKMSVWRFHDYWHAHRPDGITYGVLKKAGWLKYNPGAERVFSIPPAPVSQIADHLKTSLKIPHIRVIGNLSKTCKRIALLPGAWGGQDQISTVEKEKPDLLIVGEVHEWETAEYIRDARSFGSDISLVVLGHSVSEEPGMEWLVDWLQPKLEGTRITHIASENPFSWR